MANWDSKVLFFPGEDETAFKQRFFDLCQLHARDCTIEQIAYMLFQNLDEAELRTRQASLAWRKIWQAAHDEQIGVLNEVDVSREAILNRALAIADRPGAKEADKVNALKLIATMQGYAIKETNLNLGENLNTVMIVKDHGSNEDWEAKLEKQQSDLTNGKYTTN